MYRASEPIDEYSLLRICEAWRNTGGLLVLFATYVAVALLAAAGSTLGNEPLLHVLLGLLSAGVVLAGLTYAGTFFIDQAANRPIGSLLHGHTDSPLISLGLVITLRVIKLFFLLLVFFLLFGGVSALLLLVCKIPEVGGIFLAALIPVLTLLGSLLFLGSYIVLVLAAPALWEGNTIKFAVAQLLVIVRQRPLLAAQRFGLLLVSMFALSCVFGVLLGGSFMYVSGVAGGVLGMQIMTQSAMLGGAIGTGIVLLVVHLLLTSAFLLGLSLTYLRLISELQVGDAEAELDQALANIVPSLLGLFARRKTDAPKPAAPTATVVVGKRDFDETMMGLGLGEVRERGDFKPPPSPPKPQPLYCPQCKVVVTADDKFCGECGCKLK